MHSCALDESSLSIGRVNSLSTGSSYCQSINMPMYTQEQCKEGKQTSLTSGNIASNSQKKFLHSLISIAVIFPYFWSLLPMQNQY